MPLARRLPWMLLGLFSLAALPLGAHESAQLSAPDGKELPRGEARLDESESRVRGDGFAAQQDLEIWVAGADDTLSLASRTRTESNGSFEVRAASSSSLELAGRRIEVRGANGTVLLAGSFPRHTGDLSAPSNDDIGQGEAPLAPPPAGPLPGASGRIEVKARADRHALEVKVRGLSADTVYSVSIVNGADLAEEIGKLTTQAGGVGALEVDTHDGGVLPFGAAGVQELAGFAVQVKSDDGAIVLEGKVPSLGAGEAVEEREQEVEIELVRPASAPDGDIEGDARLEEEVGVDDKIRVRVHENGDPNAEYTALAVLPIRPEAMPFTAVLDGAQQVPPVETAASGRAWFSYDASRRELSFLIESADLSSPESAAHIHKAPAGENGDVISGLPEGNPKEGSITLSEEDAAALLAGGLYVNIHSADHPDGEIRGQILPADPERDELGRILTDEDGKGELEIRGGGALPFRATSLSELAGVAIVIEDAAGRVVLSGALPQVGSVPPDAEEVERLKLVVDLTPPAAGPIAAAHGSLELEEEGSDHEIEVELQDLVVGASYEVELVDRAGAGETILEAAADAVGDVRHRLVFFRGERLPHDVMSFAEYEGFGVRVLDADGALVLEGAISVPGSGGAADLASFTFNVVGPYDARFFRGDVDRNLAVNLTDVIDTLNMLFLGQQMPVCRDAMDTNDDGELDIADPILTLVHLFVGSRELPYPGSRVPGFDPTPDLLECEDF